MQALLVNGVAGSGKTTFIVKQTELYHDAKLLLTYSRAGCDQLQNYLQTLGLEQNFTGRVSTIDGLALSYLRRLDNSPYLLNRSYIESRILPGLLEQFLNSADFCPHADFMAPDTNPESMQSLLEDIDYFRAACCFEEQDEEVLQDKLAGNLHFDWYFVRQFFYAYENLRGHWRPDSPLDEAVDFEFSNSLQQGSNHQQFAPEGEMGFLKIDEAVYDLMQLVDANQLEEWGRQYALHCIDEFHDTSPLQLQFILALARGARKIIAVGDVHQNLYSWRGSDTDTIFTSFKHTLKADTESLNESYRFGHKLASKATAAIGLNIKSVAEHSTTVEQITEVALKKLDKQSVIIAQDLAAITRAAYSLFSHSKLKTKLHLAATYGPSMLNILLTLRYPHWVKLRSQLANYLANSLTHFTKPAYCLLSPEAKAQMQHKTTASMLSTYFDIHLQTCDAQSRSYNPTMLATLLEWRQREVAQQSVYEIMQWFEQSSRLWSHFGQRLYSSSDRASWEGLKDDAHTAGYTLEEWPRRLKQLRAAWHKDDGVTLLTVKQAKGKEFDSVLVYGADTEGFCDHEDKQGRNAFYVAITRARRELRVLPKSVRSACALPASNSPSASKQHLQKNAKAKALIELQAIKEKLKRGVV